MEDRVWGEMDSGLRKDELCGMHHGFEREIFSRATNRK